MDQGESRTLDKNTKVTAGVVAAAIVAALYADRRLASIEHEIQIIRIQQQTINDGRWSREDMKAWTSEFQRLNQSLYVPNPASESLQVYGRMGNP